MVVFIKPITSSLPLEDAHDVHMTWCHVRHSSPILSAYDISRMADTKFRSSCDSCLNSKVKCSQAKPACSRCLQQGNDCVYSQYRKIGRPSKRRPPASASQPLQEPKSSRKHSSPGLSTQRARVNSIGQGSHRSNESVVLPLNTLDLDLDHGNLEAFQSNTSPLLWDSYGTPHEGLLLSPEGVQGPLELYADVKWCDGEFPTTNVVQSSNGFEVTSLATETSRLTLPEGLLGSTEGSTPNWPMASNSLVTGSQASSTCSTDSPSQSHTCSSQPDQNSSSMHYQETFDYSSSSSAMPTQDYSWVASTHNNGHLHVAPYVDQSSAQQSENNDSAKNLLSTTECRSQCMNNCYKKLTDYLRDSNGYLSLQQTISLENLLDLDEHVGQETKSILDCSVCLSKAYNRHTLLLVTMVMENVLRLFERECGSRTFHKGEAVPSLGSSLHVNTGHTHGNSTKKTLWRKLLRIHLEKHIQAVLNLNELLGPSMGDIGFKLSREVLVDMYRRLEHLQGFVNSTKGK